jgi:LacI family transcriptional regulator
MGQGEKKVITINDVARRAGVSQATASRAFGGRGYASAEVKEKVLRAATELGYRPHAVARSLRMQRTNTMGLLIGDIINPFYAHLADGVLDCAQQSGYHVILSAHGENPAMEKEYLEVLVQQRVDGIVAVATGQNLDLWREAQSLGTRLVFVDRQLQEIPDSDSFLVDNAKGAYDMVRYMTGLGHQRIGIIIGTPLTTTGEGRLRGYYDALEEAGIAIDKDLVRIGTFRRGSGRQAAEELLSMDEQPTAIFAANNVLGEATLFVIRERGLRIPEEISLGIFDDVPWASLTAPPITAVAQPAFQLGHLSAEQLITRLEEEGSAAPPACVTLDPELIVRESCRAHPG